MMKASAFSAPQEILRCLPEALKTFVSERDLIYAEELRLRAGKRMMAVRGGQSVPLSETVVSAGQIAETVMRICNHSVYAVTEQIKNGFLVLRGGVRVGLAGCVLSREDAVENMKEFSGLNFRIPREKIGCADKLLSQIVTGGYVKNTLLLSPPGCGKTTLLRDLVRSLSGRGFRVCVLDERDEICAVHHGIAGFDVGENTDVLRLCPKTVGIELAVRTLSPQVIVADELWGEAELRAMRYAAGCGCALLTTMHGAKRSALSEELPFEVYVTLGRKNGPGTVQEVYTRA